MSLDTKFRPTSYGEVLGQGATVRVLKEYVQSGRGFHQSYLFSGLHGGGKTTLARILARALLCQNPVEGSPCDQCSSCQAMLGTGSTDSFVEVDAATNSGKSDIKKIVDDLQYSTFSGNKRVYLFDESHQLSREALDAMLKPMEDTEENSEDKRLVCIFCTTEPEKMRQTVISRCAPTFRIQEVPPKEMAQRLGEVCSQEGIDADNEALMLIAETSEGHIRDAMKSLEGVSLLGPITLDTVRSYLNLDVQDTILDILIGICESPEQAVTGSVSLMKRVSPVTVYDRLIDAAMQIFKQGLGVGGVPSYWNAEKVAKCYADHGSKLPGLAREMASRPGRPTESMLLCDISYLSQVANGEIGFGVVIPNTTKIAKKVSKQSPHPGKMAVPSTNSDGVYIDSRGVRDKPYQQGGYAPKPKMEGIDPAQFANLLKQRVSELEVDGGST